MLNFFLVCAKFTFRKVSVVEKKKLAVIRHYIYCVTFMEDILWKLLRWSKKLFQEFSRLTIQSWFSRGHHLILSGDRTQECDGGSHGIIGIKKIPMFCEVTKLLAHFHEDKW